MNRFQSIVFFLFWVAANAVAQNNLFTDELKTGDKGYVYTFIERYFGELKSIKSQIDLQNKLKDDKVLFVHGSVFEIDCLSSDWPFTLNCYDERYYEASWQKDGEELLTILFPISYELLLGIPKIEIEKTLYQEIVSANDKSTPVEHDDSVTIAQLEKVADSLYRTNPYQYYQIESLNDCQYYLIDSVGLFRLVSDTTYLQQSAINVFHSIQSQDHIIDVSQGVYGFKSLHYSITLNQWVNYCRQKGMRIYVALEEENASVLTLLIVAECRELGYNHLMSVLIPKNYMKDTATAWTAKINGYIPTHNVKNLYQNYKHRDKRNLAL